MRSIIDVAKEYGIKCHKETNSLYDGKPYEFHLNMVYDVAMKFIDCIPDKDRDNVLAACWTHDVIEDCRQTYNDVKDATNRDVAMLSYALTNEKGMTRKDRANAKYYQGIRMTRHAAFLKCCDRIANMEYSRDNGSSMFKKYCDESILFIKEIYSQEYDEVFNYMAVMVELEKFK